jgi:tetratricopeptide (TPR) repeat protein
LHEALKLIEVELDNHATCASLYLLKGTYLHELNDFSEALQYYAMYLDLSCDEDYIVYHQIGVCQQELKMWGGAFNAYSIAIELKEDLIRTHGISRMPLEKLDTLSPHSKDGVVVNVKLERMYANRANVRLAYGDPGGCIADCNVAIELNPNYGYAYFVRGMAITNSVDPELGLIDYEDALSKGFTKADKFIKEIKSYINQNKKL